MSEKPVFFLIFRVERPSGEHGGRNQPLTGRHKPVKECTDRPVLFARCYRNIAEHTRSALKTLILQVDRTTCHPCSEVKPRDLATLANWHQCLAATRHDACTWSRRCKG